MYNVLLDASGEAKLGVGDMTIHARIDPNMILGKKDHILDTASMVIVDGNLTEEAIHCTLELCKDSRKPLFFEPTDMKKATKVGNRCTPIIPNFRAPKIPTGLPKFRFFVYQSKTSLTGSR